MLGVPLLRDGVPIGVIVLTRTVVQPFTGKQVELVTTFADQAVIAIENVRLFEAEQARTKELTESLLQQTATADVLQVISRSAFDLAAVLDTLVESAQRVCEADSAFIFRRQDAGYRLSASHGFTPGYRDYMQQQLIGPGRSTLVGRTAIEGRTVHIPDVVADAEYTWAESIERGGFRTMLGVPLLREGQPIGVIALTRSTVKPFTDKQIELVTTFADQAVIAIENVRLFEAEQARRRELQESLEFQTSTSEVLRVISTSTSDLRPVYQSILQSVTRLCESNIASLFLYDGQLLHSAAHIGATPEFATQLDTLRFPPSRRTPTRRAALD
jgi:GAF domain-containing protein